MRSDQNALWRRFVGVMFSRAMSVTDRLQSLALETTLNFGAGVLSAGTEKFEKLWNEFIDRGVFTVSLPAFPNPS